MQRRARQVHVGIGLGGEDRRIVLDYERVGELDADLAAVIARHRAQRVQDLQRLLVLQVLLERLAPQAQMAVAELIDQEFVHPLVAEQRRVELDDRVQPLALDQVAGDRLDLFGRAAVEGRQRHAVGDPPGQRQVAVGGQLSAQLAPQLGEQRARVAHAVQERAHLVGADALQVVADADVVDRVAAGVEGRLLVEGAERARGREDGDQVGGLGVLAQRLRYAQLLRPLDVVADVRHVDAGPRDAQLVVHLHGLELDDAAARQPRQDDVLRQLRVRAGRRAHRRGGAAAEVAGAQVARVRPPPLAHRQVEDRTRALDLLAHPPHQRGEGQGRELGHG